MESKGAGKGAKSTNPAKNNKDLDSNNVEFAMLKKNELEILAKHGSGEYEDALDLLEQSQRIVKTHFGTQSSEVSIIE